MDFDFFSGDLSLDFINTLAPGAEPGTLQDSLNTYRDLMDWGVQAGILSPSERARRLHLDKDEPQAARSLFRQAIQLRDSLYNLVQALQEGHSPAGDDLRKFNLFLSEAQAHVELCMTSDGYHLQPSKDPQAKAMLWPIVRAASRLLTSPDARLIRRCAAEACLGFFVDRSKNHSRRWCDMKVCGNRAKARQYYAQQKLSR